jgi:hypothetical protein
VFDGDEDFFVTTKSLHNAIHGLGDPVGFGPDRHRVYQRVPRRNLPELLRRVPAEREQRVLILRFYGNLTQEQIGDRLGIYPDARIPPAAAGTDLPPHPDHQVDLNDCDVPTAQSSASESPARART